MANELTKHEQGIVAVVGSHDLGDIIKPLIREIHLFDTYVAGTTYLADPFVLGSVNVGDELHLQREENKFDSNAILILTEKKEKLGYVPEKDNIIFARLMDAGKLLKAKVSRIKPKTGYTQISIGIFLVDV